VAICNDARLVVRVLCLKSRKVFHLNREIHSGGFTEILTLLVPATGSQYRANALSKSAPFDPLTKLFISCRKG
jgi:hypothetical protein